MKLIRIAKLSTLALAFCSISAFSQMSEYQAHLKMVHPGQINQFMGKSLAFPKTSFPKTQAVEFRTFDSLANALSYGASGQEPLWWHAESNTFVTVKRGSRNPADPDFNETNSKNNFFLRTSPDLGQTWTDPEMIYSPAADEKGEGRYPSCYSFMFKNELLTVFTGSLVNEKASTWNGYLNGVSGPKTGSGAVYSTKLTQNGKDYFWGVSDGRVLGGEDNATKKFYLLATGVVTPNPGEKTDNNNIGTRRVVDLDQAQEVDMIPEQWASNKFVDVDTISGRFNETIALRMGTDGTIYQAVFGNFKSEANTKRIEFGISKSSDQGLTWSEFDVMSTEVINNYASSIGLNPDSCAIGWSSKGFAVLENGDYSFVALFREYDGSKAGTDMARQIVEVTKNAATNVWSITKVSDCTGFWVNFIAENGVDDPNANNNALDMELQISRTADGKYLIAKWVDLLNVNWVSSTSYNYKGSDIYIATRKIGESTWSKSMNITNEENELDRNTWIPYLVPDDLQNIPIIRVQSADASTYVSQRTYLQLQYVQIANFSGVVGVKEDQAVENNAGINGIYPNPSKENSVVNFTMPYDGAVTINIYDVFGNKVATVLNNIANSGLNSISFSTKEMASGTYFVTMTAGKYSVTKNLTVVH